MAIGDDAELIDRFEQFYRDYYRNEIGELAQKYPNEQRSLYLDWNDLYRYDPDIADDFVAKPGQMREYAEEALRLYDLPVDVKLGGAHVRVENLSEPTGIRDIRADHVGNLVAVQGIVRKATDVRPRMQEAAFECQRCGTLTRIPQGGGEFQEPHQCQGCERQGPFKINFDQSEFVDAQKLRVQESPEGLRGGETPQAIDINIEDDITGRVTAGDHVTATGILHLEQQGSQQEKSAIFDFYMEGLSVKVEDEQFEEMDISDEDERRIVELSSDPEIYDKMVKSMAPSIWGYHTEKLAIIMQLFSGVRKSLPDGSRIRGDIHILMIGDPGTGKCQRFDTNVTLGDGTERQLGELVERHLDDPVSIDDGVYQPVDFEVLSVTDDGRIEPATATKVWKREAPDRMYRITTESGREVEVTPSHPLFVNLDGTLDAVRADTLEEGEFLAVPRRTRPEADDSLNIAHRRIDHPNTNSLNTPESLSQELARLLGYIIGEGYVTQTSGSGGSVVITNADEEILTDARACLESFGLRSKRQAHHDSAHVGLVSCHSGEFVDFLHRLEPAILERSAGQRVPQQILGASRPIQRAFLRAYIDGECSVSSKEREITIASMSRELLEGVRSLLLRFGIESQFHPRHNDSYRLRVRGRNFEKYVTEIGFVTERKAISADEYEETDRNTNVDVVPDVGEELRRIREQLELSQHDFELPRSTYQHYERGDRNPSRASLRSVLNTFEARLDWLRDQKSRLGDGAYDWETIVDLRDELNVSQEALAASMGVSQASVSHYEKGQSVPDGGGVWIAEQTLRERIDDALAVSEDVSRLRQLAESDIGWERIDTIERLTPDYDWVYDLEVKGTHTYIGNNVVSHNSQILQYVKKLAPRSVYTSGKGSSSAGLCVTGDTLLHTEEGFTPIQELAHEQHPDPVTENTAAEREMGLYSFSRETGNVEERPSSHVWRMPEKPCRRIETAHGKELEASVNTPVLTCGDGGLEWKPIGEVTTGEYVAAPKYTDIDRETPPVGDYIEYTNEKLRLTEDSIEFVRNGLRREFGTLRDAAAVLDLTEDFIYDSLSNRFLAQEKLDRLLEAIGATREDVTVRRAMLAHGSSVRIPREFDEELLYLIGLVFGDGDISLDARGGNRGMVRISNSNEALLERAAAIIGRKFDRQVEIEYQEGRVPCIRLNSATVTRFFSNVGMESPKENLELDSRLTTAEHADAFLRGLMDADGSVSSRTSGGSSIQLSTISEPLAKQVQLMLETYGVAARRRRRDRRGEHTLENGYTIESKHVQQHLTVYGRHIDQYAETVGFEAAEKRAALETLVGASQRRKEKIPVGGALQAAEIGSGGGSYYMNFTRGNNPGRGRARAILDAFDLGRKHIAVEEAVDADLVWEEVTAAVDTGEKEVYDLTVPETHNFLGNGLVTHNTAAAVRDDFGEGQQWTLEAGALVLADQGVAAVDELDKMRSEDQSAMHQALEQQEISISKAGINATLKSRCSLLGAANPTYGRFDEYEPVGEQIDLEPALISRFDLIFTVTDKPDKEKDQQLAEHIIKTNYAGELNTHRVSVSTSNVSQEEVDTVTEEVVPEIDPELLRKYVAYAKRNCYPTMTEEAKTAIRDFYVDMRTQGSDDSAVPVTARKLEALVRLAEASARIRLSDRVTTEDTDRVIAIVQASLEDVGMDPETGELDADMVEAGTSKSQRDRIKNVKGIIRELQDEYDDGAPYDQVLERAEAGGIERSKAEHEIQKLKDRGDIYEPKTDHLRVV